MSLTISSWVAHEGFWHTVKWWDRADQFSQAGVDRRRRFGALDYLLAFFRSTESQLAELGLHLDSAIAGRHDHI